MAKAPIDALSGLQWQHENPNIYGKTGTHEYDQSIRMEARILIVVVFTR